MFTIDLYIEKTKDKGFGVFANEAIKKDTIVWEFIEGLDPELYYAQGTPYTVKRTSYNSQIRYNYAGIGYTYDPIDDAFIAPMPQCGHDQILLNAQKNWECAACEAAIKQSRDSTA